MALNFEGIGYSFSAKDDGVAKMQKSLQAGFVDISDALDKLSDRAVQTSESMQSMGTMGRVFSGLLKGMNLLLRGMSGVAGFMDGMSKGAVVDLADSASEIVDSLNDVDESFDDTADTVDEAVDSMSSSVIALAK